MRKSFSTNPSVSPLGIFPTNTFFLYSSLTTPVGAILIEGLANGRFISSLRNEAKKNRERRTYAKFQALN